MSKDACGYGNVEQRTRATLAATIAVATSPMSTKVRGATSKADSFLDTNASRRLRITYVKRNLCPLATKSIVRRYGVGTLFAL